MGQSTTGSTIGMQTHDDDRRCLIGVANQLVLLDKGVHVVVQ